MFDVEVLEECYEELNDQIYLEEAIEKTDDEKERYEKFNVKKCKKF